MQTPVLPRQFIDRISRLYGMIPAHVEEMFDRRSLSVRINTLKSDRLRVEKELNAYRITFKKIKWQPDALVLDISSAKQITNTSLYRDGHIYIQSLSSMVPALVLDPQPAEKILDMAAAPGSKTSQIAAMMHNAGEIVANDIDKKRLYKLHAVLDMLGVENVSVTSLAGQGLWRTFPETFDRILLDAPCSVEGRFDINQPKSYESWSLKKVKSLSRLQKWMLRSAVSATKPGGIIVYSTCTLSPEENEGVVDWVLEKDKEVVQIEDIRIDGLLLEPGKTAWEKKMYDADLAKTKRIMPSDNMEGFYIAKLKKIKSNVSR